jgi:hypothetical protein
MIARFAAAAVIAVVSYAAASRMQHRSAITRGVNIYRRRASSTLIPPLIDLDARDRAGPPEHG